MQPVPTPVDEVWKMPLPDSNKPLGLDLLEFAVWKARSLGLPDPECAAAEAMLHLFLVTVRELHRFVRVGGDVDVMGLRAWSRTVIGNHLYSQGRKHARELKQLVSGVTLEDHSDPQSLLAEQWLRLLDLQIAQLCVLYGLPPQKQFRVMARLSEFTHEDLAILEEITVKGIEKFFAWLRRVIDTEFESFPKKITRRFRNPADDEPLATADTPLLAEKLTTSKKDAQKNLVKAIDGLPQSLRFPFFSRVIGY